MTKATLYVMSEVTGFYSKLEGWYHWHDIEKIVFQAKAAKHNRRVENKIRPIVVYGWGRPEIEIFWKGDQTGARLKAPAFDSYWHTEVRNRLQNEDIICDFNT